MTRRRAVRRRRMNYLHHLFLRIPSSPDTIGWYHIHSPDGGVIYVRVRKKKKERVRERKIEKERESMVLI